MDNRVVSSYRLSSLLIIATWICVLFGLFSTLGHDALFILLPSACICVGYIVGQGMRYPLTGAAIGTSLFLAYVATMPFVVLLWKTLPPSNLLASVMNSYWMPYGEWADCFDAWEIIGIWEGFVRRMPIVAAVSVLVMIAGINVTATITERRVLPKAGIN